MTYENVRIPTMNNKQDFDAKLEAAREKSQEIAKMTGKPVLSFEDFSKAHPQTSSDFAWNNNTLGVYSLVGSGILTWGMLTTTVAGKSVKEGGNWTDADFFKQSNEIKFGLGIVLSLAAVGASSLAYPQFLHHQSHGAICLVMKDT